MRSFTKTLAASAIFNNNSAAFSTSGVIPNSTAFFGSQGSLGGPTAIQFSEGLSIQANFGGGSNPQGQFNVMASNVLEYPNFCVAASAQVSTSGSILFNSAVLGVQYKFIDFQFIPSSAGSSGFVTVVCHSKGSF